MRTIPAAAITDVVAELCIKANTQLPPDIVSALDASRQNEPWPLAKQTLGLLWDNMELAETKNLPICQDTGMACVFVELVLSFEPKQEELQQAKREKQRFSVSCVIIGMIMKHKRNDMIFVVYKMYNIFSILARVYKVF